MVAVGLWGAFLGAPAIYILPVVFPLVMAVGGVLGILGVPLPGVEIGIAMSAAVLGMMVALAARPPLWVAGVIVGAFAICHGHAHGAELPPGADALAYSAGFVDRDRPSAPRRHRLRSVGALARGADRGARGRRRHRHRRLDVSGAAAMTGFWAGLLHPVLMPDACSMAILALALLIGRQRWHRTAAIVYAAAVLAGLGLIALALCAAPGGEAIAGGHVQLTGLSRGTRLGHCRVGSVRLLAGGDGFSLALDSPPEAISLREAN